MKIRHIGCSLLFHCATAMWTPVSSAAYTLYCVSSPRYWWLISLDDALYAAAPILPSMPDPSVYIVMMSLRLAASLCSSSCRSAASFLVAAACSSVVGIHHGGRMYGSMVSSFCAMYGNCWRMFSKLERCLILAVLVRIAFASHCFMGCFSESDCILIAARRTFICRRIQAGWRPDSISMAAVGVVR